MLRALVALLLVANLGFLALSRGWLAPTFSLDALSQREPQRLAAQIDPQSIQILAPEAARAARAQAADAGCMRSGLFKADQIAAAEAVLSQAVAGNAQWTRQEMPRPAQWLLTAPRAEVGDAQRRQQEQLKTDGFAVEAAPVDAGPNGLVLGRFESRDAADAALADAQSRGIHAVKVLAVPAATQYALRVTRANPALRARLQSLDLPNAGAGFKPCSQTP